MSATRSATKSATSPSPLLSRRACLQLLALSGCALVAAPVVSVEGDHSKKPVKRILLYSGWATHNIGDVGHTPGTLRYLTQYLPGVHVTCWLRKSTPAVLAMLTKRFPQVVFIENATLDNQGKASTPELQTAFDQADLFIHNSGMHFTRYWQPPVGLIHACAKAKKPIGLYGQSFDGFRAQDAESLPHLLSQAAFIFCRDNESLGFLRSQGVTPKILEFGPDGCFGIDVRDEAWATHFMQANGLESRKFITVTLRTDKEISKNPGQDESGKSSLTPEEWADKLRELMIAWVEQTDLKIVIVPEVEKEIEPGKRLLLDPLPDAIKANVVHLDRWWNVEQATALFAHTHTVVNVEPHSSIMALAMGTPTIHWFTWRHGYKAWMFRDIGLSEWLIDIDSEPTSRAISTLMRIHERYDLALTKVKRAMTTVDAREAEMCSDIRTLLKPS